MPGFLMPKPGAAAEPADPWRERLAQAEVQVQATRALAQRTSDDAAATRQRAEGLEGRVRALETELAARIAALEALPKGGAPGPASSAAPEGALEKIERVDKLVVQARVALDTIQQDLAEHARLFSARKARLDSLEQRVQKTESDPRITELGRKVEAFDLRLSTILPQLDEVAAIAPRVAALETAVAELPGRIERLVAEAVERALVARAAPKTGKTAKPAEPEDELQGLKGVGPKLAKSLRELGVTRVAEIAAWTDEDVARFAEKLGTTVAKIKKAGWVEAARAAG